MSDDFRPIPATDRRLRWLGHVSLEPIGDEALRPWRIPFASRALFPGVETRAAHAAGVRIELSTDARQIAIDADYGSYDENGNDPRPIQIVDGDEVVDVDAAGGATVALPGEGVRTVEVWLPQWGVTTLRGLRVEADARVNRVDEQADERPRWVTYGSSITQCRDASGPLAAWPARVAREQGLDLTCLGFGGQCKLDSMVARLIRDLPADYVSVCCGINLHPNGMDARVLRAAVIGTVEIIREGHPDVPLCLISPIWSPDREDAPADGLTLRAMREVIGDVVEILRDRGDEALHYVDGLSIFGEEHVAANGGLDAMMPDRLHPSDAAQPIVAANVAEHVVRGVFGHDADAPV